MATGLLVLKIIGVILLGILGFLLALILIVLLAPVRYRAEASYYGEGKAKAEVTWLLRIISCKAVYDGELDMGIRIFGFRVGGKEEPDGGFRKDVTRDGEAGQGESPGNGSAEREQHLPKTEKNAQDEQTGSEEAGQAKQLEEEILAELIEERREEERAEQEHKKEAAPEQKKKRKQRLKMPFSFQGICDKLKQAGEQKDKAVEFLKKEENQKTFRLLKRQIKALLLHILPGKMRGKVKFGFDDPYTTGQVLMYISPFYGMYGKRFQIIPVFEEPVLEGEVWLRGRVRIGTVLAIGIRMLFDKNFRTLLRKWRK